MAQFSQQNDVLAEVDAQRQHDVPRESPLTTTTTTTTTSPPSSSSSSPTTNAAARSPASASEPGTRSLLRTPAPSPLHTSTTPTSPPSSVTPTRSAFVRGGGADQSDPSPASPKERLEDLLAARNLPRAPTHAAADLISAPDGPRISVPHNTNGPSRSCSDPFLVSQSSSTSTGGSLSGTTRPPMALNAAPRIEMARGPPRTSSIDSAISSISIPAPGGHATHATRDLHTGSPPDIANLIHAAGSPEAAIQYLLKDKTSQASQNSQLWRLVDKQRAMILGLNKDLERAVKDKERYRNKLKETLAQLSNPSPVDSNQELGSENGSISSESRRTEMKPGAADVVVPAGLRGLEQELPPSPIDIALAPYPITPPLPTSPGVTLKHLVEADQKMPSPTKHAYQNYDPDAPAPGFEAAQQQREANELARELPLNVSIPPSRSLLSEPPSGPPPSAPPPKAPRYSQRPTLNLIESSPYSDEGPKPFASPPRKGPPAPLNLSTRIDANSHLRQASGAAEETDSDHDDILEVGELPTLNERGRRKTREEDDRDREVAAAKDAEIRSLSKKSGTSKSRTSSPKDDAPSMLADPVPTSPRQAVQIPPPDAHLRHLAPQDANAASLAGVLSDVSILLPPALKSPGLPQSPRPVDRSMRSSMPYAPSNRSSAMNTPALTPRGVSVFPGAISLTPRAPRQPIPLPPNTPLSIASPGLPKGSPLQLVSPRPLNITGKAENASPKDRAFPAPQAPGSHSIYKGLTTEEYPDLLLPPNALPSIDVKVASSRLKPSRASTVFPRNTEEDPVFTLAVFARSDRRELWRVEKDSLSLATLDQTLRQSNNFTAKIPERSLFTGHAPAKVDARRAALDKYLEDILDTQMDIASALEICRYLSTNTMAPYSDDLTPAGDLASEGPAKTGPGGRPLKNGYLTKRGKNFGGWKARYFVLDGPILKYYECPGGPHLGAIKLQNAQIGKQQQQQAETQPPPRGETEDSDNQYRHAFLILEAKQKDSSSLVRHVLCAESDPERDQWVDALMLYVDYKDGDSDHNLPTSKQRDRKEPNVSASSNGKPKKNNSHAAPGRSQALPDLGDESLRGVSYENTKQGSIPTGSRLKNSGAPSPPAYVYEKEPTGHVPQLQPMQSMKTISAPKNAQLIQDTSSWGNKQQNLLAPAVTDVKQKKRSFFGFGSKPRASYDADILVTDSNNNLTQMMYDQQGSIRPVFGAPLGEAVRYNHPVNVSSIGLPAVVYRCIEYLDAKNAAGEEGIFRLSGSNIVIKQLRERFNVEGDVNLITDEQYYDIHAVASLLKLYLRELPTTILTRDLHLEFLGVTELRDVNQKITALNALVHRLPPANFALLRYLASFLINIINHSDTNKMTVRNVGIVFSPTLNIPAPVFALFLQQYDGIFGAELDGHDGFPTVSVAAHPLNPEDIRSPRRQKFQDLPTPNYDQQSFPRPQPGFPPPKNYKTPPQQRPNYDTGLAPLQPSYEQFSNHSGYSRQHSQYGSEHQGSSKSKRRESNMFSLNMGGIAGQQRASSSKLRADAGLVEEQSFFD